MLVGFLRLRSLNCLHTRANYTPFQNLSLRSSFATLAKMTDTSTYKLNHTMYVNDFAVSCSFTFYLCFCVIKEAPVI